MSHLTRQGNSWIIITHVSDISDAKTMLETVNKQNYADYTSAKGINSKQHYIIPPSWMPSKDHNFPDKWDTISAKYSLIVQKELVHYGIMPLNWKKLYARSAWTVKGEEGSYHTIHEHGPNSVSTILYTTVPPKGEDDIPYTNGSTYFVMDGSAYNDLSIPACRVMHVTPKEGMLVIFPSYILHGVYPQGPGLRQTLNIDYHGDPNFTYGLGTGGSTSYN